MATKENRLITRMILKQDQYNRELKKLRQQQQSFNKYMSQSSKMIQRNLVNMFGIFTAGAVFRDIGRTITGFEKQMDKVQAISGSTEKQMERLSKSAIDLGRASKFTAGEIGQLQEELARLGFSSSEIIDSTDAIRKLATAADSELNEAAKTVAATLNSFGMEAKEAGEISNIMAESFSKSALDLEKFSVGMANVGATANAAGVSLADTTAMLGILNNSGIDASKAGTDLRKIFTDLAVRGQTLEDALSQIRGSTDKVKTAFELFGQRASTSAILLAENEEAAKTLSSTLSDTNKELDGMVEIMEDNLITDLQKLKSAWDAWILSLENGSGAGSKALREMSQWATELLNAFSGDVASQASLKGFGKEFETAKEGAKNYFSTLEMGIQKEEELAKWMGVWSEKVKEADNGLQRFKALGVLEGLKDIEEELTSETEEANKAFDQLDQTFLGFINSSNDVADGVDNITDSIKDQIEATKRLLSIRVQKTATRAEDTNPFAVGAHTFSNGTNLMDIPSSLKQMEDAGAASRQKIWENWQAIAQMNQEMGLVMRDTAMGALGGFAEGLGFGGVEQAFNNLTNVFADGISRIGDALIAYGLAMTAAKLGLKNPFTSGPAALAAGLAAKVFAGAIRSAASSTLNAGSGGGGSSGPSGSFQNNIQGQAGFNFPKEIVLKARGNDLVGVLDMTNRQNSRNRAGR